MKTYLVGGAVRDSVLGLNPSDRDYVVVGGSVEEMLELGFQQVGADFPVFLHPETGDEYALARVERKHGKGYTGFSVSTEDVTLEDDLRRRDLTINSMAFDLETGELIDPFNGQLDLTLKIATHTSAAFVEDPLRVLRMARLCAKLDLTPAAETSNLCYQMILDRQLAELTQERVWLEVQKAVELGPKAIKFFTILQNLNAFELVPSLSVFKPMVLTYLQKMLRNGASFEQILGLFMHVSRVTPTACPALSLKIAKVLDAYSLSYWESFSMLKASAKYEMLYHADCFRSSWFLDFLQVYGVSLLAIKHDLKKVLSISGADLLAEGFEGKQLGLELKARRLKVL